MLQVKDYISYGRLGNTTIKIRHAVHTMLNITLPEGGNFFGTFKIGENSYRSFVTKLSINKI